MTTEDKGKLFILFVPLFTLSLLSKIVCSLCRDLKVHALHYANELLVGVRLSFQNLLQTRSKCRDKTKKNVWEKRNDVYSLSIRVQTTINDISIFTFLFFLPQYQRQKNAGFSKHELKKTLRDTLTRAAWLGPSNFHWFALSMRMRDSLFAGSGSAPIGGRKKGEFRDWTRCKVELVSSLNFSRLLPLPRVTRAPLGVKRGDG